MSRSWSEKNQKYLMERINEVKAILRNYVNGLEGKAINEKRESHNRSDWNEALLPACETISELFSLSAFETNILILCAGMELDAEVSILCARAQGNSAFSYPTFSLALAVFSDAHWTALTPIAPLRQFRLIDFYGPPQWNLVTSPIKIQERVLHFLIGISCVDKDCQGLVNPVRLNPLLTPTHWNIVDNILSAWKSYGSSRCLIQLIGPNETSKQEIAYHACNRIGLTLWHMPAELIPSKPDELYTFVNLWSRESALLAAGLFISAEDLDAAGKKNVIRLIENGIAGPIFLGSLDRWLAMDGLHDLAIISVEVSKPDKVEQKEMWKHYLRKHNIRSNVLGLENGIERLVNQFDLFPSSIESTVLQSALAVKNKRDGIKMTSELWKNGRIAARRKMNELAQHIIPKANENDLVLPEKQKHVLHNIMIHTKHREKVYGEWGFADINNRGLGISALFVGGSGTGKTMAAEVLANKLDLDLFRIDLSMVVNKYIGETEKNLRQLFDAAEDGGAILFFDEADALFGKRSEVHDSHDRYANIEIGYLLQRMESYKGLAILATNMKDVIDPAFIRRIRFIVNFPFPDEDGRKEIWKRVFPSETPKKEIRYDVLAKLHITGGNIHNIAMNASFLAAEDNVPVNMGHIKQAIYAEYDKLERPLDVFELADSPYD